MGNPAFGYNPQDVERLAEFFKTGRHISYDRGQFVIRAFDPPAGVYFIRKGHIRTYTITNEGQENIHSIFGPGEIFPLIWTFTGEHREVFYEAMNSTTLYRVARADLKEYLTQQPQVLMHFVRQLIVLFRFSQDRIEALEQRHANLRVAACIMHLATRFGKASKIGIRITAPVRHHDIANMINVSRETASRVISELETAKLIVQSRHVISVPSVRRLRRYVDDSQS